MATVIDRAAAPLPRRRVSPRLEDSVSTVSPGSFRLPLDLAPAVLARRIGRWNEPALLESGAGFGAAGRWSILAARPRLIFEAEGTRCRTETRSEQGGTLLVSTENRHPIEAVDAFVKNLGIDRRGATRLSAGSATEASPFPGGLIGFFGYDLAPSIERLPRRAVRDCGIPDVRLGLYDTAVVVDHDRGTVDLWAHDLLGEGASTTEARLHDWARELGRASPTAIRRSRLGPITSNFSEVDYLDAVRRTLEYIAAGDIFQANLSQRFSAVGEVDALDLYLRLKEISPAPFGAFLRWTGGDGVERAVVSASPEWFYQTEGDRIVTRPIKGTRPRGATPEADRRLAVELASSPKDRAELTMIVDLERNDLGRICRFGTIRVTDALTVESFAQVHHLVATIEGRLRPEVGAADIVRAVFPGGSITGAPKIRAMQIIDELEPTRRNLYTGAIGFLGLGGSSMFNIAIRTLLIEGPRVSYQVGGGIVADSDPLAEYHETLHKGRGLRQVLSESED
ncbi:MAG: aminodeoxychorismate synthase component I [Isosphaeraceae bacterium]